MAHISAGSSNEAPFVSRETVADRWRQRWMTEASRKKTHSYYLDSYEGRWACQKRCTAVLCVESNQPCIHQMISSNIQQIIHSSRIHRVGTTCLSHRKEEFKSLFNIIYSTSSVCAETREDLAQWRLDTAMPSPRNLGSLGVPQLTGGSGRGSGFSSTLSIRSRS